jgi:hypothetical protein
MIRINNNKTTAIITLTTMPLPCIHYNTWNHSNKTRGHCRCCQNHDEKKNTYNDKRRLLLLDNDNRPLLP